MSARSITFTPLALCVIAGCVGEAEPQAAAAIGAVRRGAPPDVIHDDRGRAYLRRDRWASAEFERIMHEAIPTADHVTVAALAAQLRGHVQSPDGYFIEQDLDLELAQAALDGSSPAPIEPVPPREGRDVMGASDNRTRVTANTTYPWTAMAMYEATGTGTMIGASTMVTAAHVVFRTEQTWPGEGWYCRDGTTDFDSNPCDDTPGAGGDFVPGDPRWRWGMEGTQVFRGPATCFTSWVPSGFVSLPGAGMQGYDAARWDYAVVDFSPASCGDRFPGNATGTLGYWALTDAQINNATANLWGYPVRADDCPQHSAGDYGWSNDGTTIVGTDCPGTGSWPGSTWRILPSSQFPWPPFTGGVIYGHSTSDVTPGSSQATRTIQSGTIDVTLGQSGAAFYFVDNSQNCGLPSCRYVFGTMSNCGALDQNGQCTKNIGNRVTTEVFNFIAAHSPDF